jgi:hypothetical protein
MPKAPLEPTGRTTPKVSQKTINEIKKMGMKDALKLVKMFADQSTAKGKGAATMAGEGKKFLAGETAEGIRRMYGDRRFAEATGATKKKPAAKPNAKVNAYGPKNTPAYRPATASSLKSTKKK